MPQVCHDFRQSTSAAIAVGLWAHVDLHGTGNATLYFATCLYLQGSVLEFKEAWYHIFWHHSNQNPCSLIYHCCIVGKYVIATRAENLGAPACSAPTLPPTSPPAHHRDHQDHQPITRSDSYSFMVWFLVPRVTYCKVPKVWFPKYTYPKGLVPMGIYMIRNGLQQYLPK